MPARTLARVLVVVAFVLASLGAVTAPAGGAPPWWTPPGGGVPPEPPEPALDLIASWNGAISDSEGLCYTITVPANVDLGFDVAAAIVDAVTDWAAPVNALSSHRDLMLTDGTTNGCTNGVDVDIVLRRGGGRVQGVTSFDSAAGLITGASIVVRGNFAGTSNPADTIQLIARHEFGHALGLGHWNIDDQLMSSTLNATEDIGDCEAAAVVHVQGWYFNGAGGPALYDGDDPFVCDPT
jgi:hypothetical protein